MVASILPVVAVLVSTTVICADVPVVSVPQDDQPALAPHRQSDIRQQRSTESRRPVRKAPASDSSPRNLMDMVFGVAMSRVKMDFSIPPEAGPGPKPLVLPADLSSITMFLTASGPLGAWQFVRSPSGGKFHFARVHEWYHTNASVQVGHVSAFDPDAQVSPAHHRDQSPERRLGILLTGARDEQENTTCQILDRSYEVRRWPALVARWPCGPPGSQPPISLTGTCC